MELRVPRQGQAWLKATAATMRELGVLQASRTITRKDGSVEQISLTLGPPPMAVHSFPSVEDYLPGGTSPTTERATKRSRYADVFPGQSLSDEDLDRLPDNPFGPPQ